MAQTHYTAFTVQTGQVTGTLTDFPVGILVASLARLATVANGGHVAGSDGFDIRPYSDAGLSSAMTYELVSYDPATGQLEMYVLVPSLTDSSVIYLGYGDAALNTDGSSASTWNSGFEAVYHFGDESTLSLLDSTANNLDLTNNGSTPRAAAAFAGSAASFDGSTQNLEVATAPMSALPGTVSLLFNPTASVSTIVGLEQFSGGSGIYFEIQNVGTKGLRASPGNVSNAAATADNAYTSGSWNYAQGRFVNATSRAVRCGSLTGTNTNSQSPGTVSGLSIGARHLNGSISSFSQTLVDELRVSSVDRGDDWGVAELNNLTAPSSFYAVGAEQTVGAGVFNPPPSFFSSGVL